MWVIVVHGGAKEIEPHKEDANRQGCLRALSAGQDVLSAGGAAIDAVEAAIRVLEDDPTFNAGYGSALTCDGEVEMCAGIMDGGSLNIGAVATIKGVQHPIGVAKLMLLEKEVLMTGEGARHFAQEHGAQLCEPAALVTPEQVRTLSKQRDTVGAVALDMLGGVAAGCSTGGLPGSRPGRVGDSPQPGCGYYADNLVGAVAFSGDGEEIARVMSAARAIHLLESADPRDAIERVLKRINSLRAEAGAIAVNTKGNVGWGHSTPHFAVAMMTSEMEQPCVSLRGSGSR